MGFNATRRYRDGKLTDIAILLSATVLIGGLVAWAAGLFG